MYVLGISNGHVATAVLLKDGEVIACASEERFNNKKSFNGFPAQAIDWCLEYARIQGTDIDLVATPYLYRPPIHTPEDQRQSQGSLHVLYLLSKALNFFRYFYRRIRFRIPQTKILGVLAYRLAALTVGKYFTYKYKQYVAEYLKISKSRVIAYDHHLSHAAAAYYASQFNTKKALVFTLDAEGDNYCSSVSIFEGKEFKVLAKTPRENSFGYIFGAITKFLGMKPHEHEYKVMGLAPYAKDEDVDKLYEVVKETIYLDPKNMLKMSSPFNTQDYDQYLEKNLRGKRFDHIAGAYQKLVEELVTKWITEGIKRTGISTVVLSGGVFMNVKANKRIAELKEVKELYALPSCSDESAPLGAAYLGSVNTQIPKPIKTLYWGPEYTDEQIEKVLKESGKHKFEKHKNIEKEIAKLLASGNVVANSSGRMEFGARALGNRSILANPQNTDTIRLINEQIKNRDFWMPFAPSILKERAKNYIKSPKIESPFMMFAFDSTESAQTDLRAALHPYDMTMRAQILSEEENPRYYKIIKEFENLTGIGGVLNTSFNLHGYPIARGPVEALFTFENSELQYLALGSYLVTK